MKETRLEDLNLSTFTPLVNSSFFARQDTGELIHLILVEAKPLSIGGKEGGPNAGSFSLIFHGPDRCFLSQKLHTFEHEKIGTFSLFIVPVGKAPGIIQYQAVFNRAA
jgi:hypothetical protein